MGPVVLGIEGDIARRRGTDFTSFLGAYGLDSFNVHNEHGWIGTVRPRVGLAADNWLFYSTGGLAHDAANTDGRAAAAGSTRTGWMVGGGIEYASGKQWSLGLEYLYSDFGKSAQSQSGAATPGTTDDRSQVVRGRLNYRFGWDGFTK